MSAVGEAQFTALRDLLRQRVLHALFPPAVAWSLVLVLLGQIADLVRVNPFPEGGMAHRLFEVWVQPLAALVILVAVIGLQDRVLRRWPGFLRLPSPAPLFATASRLIIHGAGWFLATTVGAVLLLYLFYDPATDPQGQFHLWVWAGGLLYAIALTPVAAILSVWMRLRGSGGEAP